MDLDSTHGTSINRKDLTPRSYVALRSGAQVRLGQSSRTLALMGEVEPTREVKPTAQSEAEKEAAAEKRAAARAERIAQTTGRSMVVASDLHGFVWRGLGI